MAYLDSEKWGKLKYGFDQHLEAILDAGEYIIDGRLGTGLRGEVLGVRHVDHPDELLALKIVPFRPKETYFVNQFAPAALPHELLQNNAVKHPHIMPVQEIAIRERFGYVIMPRALGGTVGDLYNTEVAKDPAIVSTIVHQLGGAYQAYADANFFSTDISCANTLLMKPFDGTPESVFITVTDPGHNGYWQDKRTLTPNVIAEAKAALGIDAPVTTHSDYFFMSTVRLHDHHGYWTKKATLPEQEPSRLDNLKRSLRYKLAYKALNTSSSLWNNPRLTSWCYGTKQPTYTEKDVVTTDITDPLSPEDEISIQQNRVDFRGHFMDPINASMDRKSTRTQFFYQEKLAEFAWHLMRSQETPGLPEDRSAIEFPKHVNDETKDVLLRVLGPEPKPYDSIPDLSTALCKALGVEPVRPTPAPAVKQIESFADLHTRSRFTGCSSIIESTR